MLALALAQMRSSLGRLVAAGIAIVLGTGFVTATLLGLDAITSSARDAVTATLGKTDAVVEPTENMEALPDVLATPGVAAAHSIILIGLTLESEGRSEYLAVSGLAPHPDLQTATVLTGALPAASSEIALSDAIATRLGLSVGDSATVTRGVVVDDAERTERTDVRIVGLLEDLTGVSYSAPRAMVTPEQFTLWSEPGSEAGARVLVLGTPGTSEVELAAALRDSVTGVNVHTRTAYADATIKEYTGSINVLAGFVLAFAAIALFVAAIVIANTFQVIVAQRTRTLALLRCVGATRSQVRRSILIEAGILGTAASITGVLLGALALQVTLAVLSGQALGVPMPTTIMLTPSAVLLPIVVGILVTLAAALAPARAATRVAPVAALRPLESPQVRGGSRARVVWAIVLFFGGLALVTLAMVMSLTSEAADPMLAVVIGVLGGGVSFTGLLLGALFLVAPTSRLLGVAASAAAGVPGQLATANSVRNPRRTTATATAIIIGSTLVALMATGAASARVTMAGTLDSFTPIDLLARTSLSEVEQDQADGTATRSLSTSGLTSLQRDTLASTDGIAGVVEVHGTLVDTDSEDFGRLEIHGKAPGVENVMRHTRGLDDLRDDELVTTWGLDDGQTITLTGIDPGSESITLTVRRSEDSPVGYMIVTQATLDRLDPDAPVTDLWAKVTNVNDPVGTVNAVQNALTDISDQVSASDPRATAAPYVTGAVVERAGFQQVIDTMLAIVLGLLAVAVVIALIGVANTLSLSVLERRRESATLRALGLTTRQLRQSLAIEGIMLATVGALIGVVMGLVYGVMGSAVLLGQLDEFAVAVPWREVLAVFVIAIVAGLAASVLPSRSAARTSPVAALAAD